jgi:translation initiation factor IF-2
MTEETKTKLTEGAKVVEKRIKPSVIRRRAAKVEEAPPPPLKEEAKAVPAPEGVIAPPAEAVKAVEEIKEGIKAEAPAEKKPVEIAAGKPAEAKKEEKPHAAIGVVGHITEVVPSLKEEWKDRLKKGPRRRKSRAELEMDTIKRAGGLKHFADLVVEEVIEEPAAAPAVEERVFEPAPTGRKKKGVRRQFKQTQITVPKAIKKIIRVEEGITVSSLSQAMGVKSSELIKKLMNLGLMMTANQLIDAETAALLAQDYGFNVEHTAFKEEDVLAVPEAHVSVKNLAPRSPVVTVMGHVDHGKTSILDVIRKTHVADQEAGGITQHIGAYEVSLTQGSITFLDTPGHEAFTTMRARGAQATDIVVLVVAADDGVMPQTIEAIDHAKAAGVPIVVAINKIDLPAARPEVVMKALAERNLVPEEWGGDTIFVRTSARTKEGIDKLLEMILLQAEVLELKADFTVRPKGVIVEARLDKAKGPVATVLIQEGKLEVGQYVVCGMHSGRVRGMTSADGRPCKQAWPSKPVEITGLSGVPDAGDLMIGVQDEKSAKLVSELRQQKTREASLRQGIRFSLEDLQRKAAAGELQELLVILKTDVQGSIEAISDALAKLSTDQVKVKILHSGVGNINESDVLLAKASEAIIIGFNVMPDQMAQQTAELEGVEIRTYRIIYELLDEMRKAMAGLLAPALVEKILGRAEVREIFRISKIGTIAGCLVSSGSILRSANARLLRDQGIIFDGRISSLKRFKDDVREVKEGFECGIGLENFNDVKVGDTIVAYIIEKKAATL